MDTSTDRMKELIRILDEAAKAYYQEDREVISNYEYDKLYDELLNIEKETGMVLAGSPSEKIGYEILSELPKEAHDEPMLSLDKTKSVDELKDWLGMEKALLSWKLDGLTIVLTYRGGKLVKAVTRGNGELGEVITNNAKVFKNIPLTINYRDELILRGEAVIRYSDFEKINEEIEDVDAKYKNPRNLCSGSVRQLNNEITAKRNVNFFAFSLVKAEGIDFKNSNEQKILWLNKLGFETVEYRMTDKNAIEKDISYFSERISANDFPSDGLVLLYDDIDYGRSLGRTSKFPRNSIAFKWADEVRETTLQNIEWSPSRTGLINPIAVFEPVELEGTTVSRASVHNISIMKGLELGIGDRIKVYKANMIIPQIAENLTKSGVKNIPEHCPVCGGITEIKQINDVQSLYCTNSECQAKKIKAFTLFVSRDALNIEGLSEATLEKFIANGFIKEFADIFHLEQYENEIMEMEGFGEKSYQNLLESIRRSRNTTLPKLIYSLGIANIGLANAKVLCRHFNFDIEALKKASVEELSEISGIGNVIGEAFVNYFADKENTDRFERLWNELEVEIEAVDEEAQFLKGVTFVITGSVEHFSNRNEIKELIESKGGKVTGSVSAKTQYLLNNDVTSNSSKNKKAKELGIPIISEEDFLKLIEEGAK